MALLPSLISQIKEWSETIFCQQCKIMPRMEGWEGESIVSRNENSLNLFIMTNWFITQTEELLLAHSELHFISLPHFFFHHACTIRKSIFPILRGDTILPILSEHPRCGRGAAQIPLQGGNCCPASRRTVSGWSPTVGSFQANPRCEEGRSLVRVAVSQWCAGSYEWTTETITCMSFPKTVQWHHVDSLKSTTVQVFVLQGLATLQIRIPPAPPNTHTGEPLLNIRQDASPPSQRLSSGAGTLPGTPLTGYVCTGAPCWTCEGFPGCNVKLMDLPVQSRRLSFSFCKCYLLITFCIPNSASEFLETSTWDSWHKSKKGVRKDLGTG